MSDKVYKQFAASIEKGDGRVRRFVISTASKDRDNDTVDPNGWQLDNYLRNPVVLWAHDYKSLPLAKAIDVRVHGGALVAEAEFADHDFANTVLRLLDGGFLNATSVGFRPTKYVQNELGGCDFKEQELLEFSVVPVPANPEALQLASAKGIDLAALRKWALAADDEPVVEIAEPGRLDIDERDLAAVLTETLHDLVASELGAVTQREVRRGLDRARGRIVDDDPPEDPAVRRRSAGPLIDIEPGTVRQLTAEIVRQATSPTNIRDLVAAELRRRAGRVY